MLLSSLFTEDANFKKREKIDSDILNNYQNVKFNGNCNSKKKIIELIKNESLNRYVQKSKFFSDVDDGEKQQKKAVTKITKTNPRFILDKSNEAELEKDIEDVNSISKQFMQDSGLGVFNYDPPDADQVGIVKSSNQSYTNRRDRFFIPEQKPNQSLIDYFKELELDKKAMNNSQRKGKNKNKRR